jgi:predicted N-acyltransferase
VADYLEQERAYVREAAEELDGATPFRQAEGPNGAAPFPEQD